MYGSLDNTMVIVAVLYDVVTNHCSSDFMMLYTTTVAVFFYVELCQIGKNVMFFFK